MSQGAREDFGEGGLLDSGEENAWELVYEMSCRCLTVHTWGNGYWTVIWMCVFELEDGTIDWRMTCTAWHDVINEELASTYRPAMISTGKGRWILAFSCLTCNLSVATGKWNTFFFKARLEQGRDRLNCGFFSQLVIFSAECWLFFVDMCQNGLFFYQLDL